MHKSLDEFEFLPYPTIYYGVSLERLKNHCFNVVATVVP